MNILYGVPSEGMGHATRSKVLIAHLLEKHNVQVVTSDRAFTFLNESFPGHVQEIKGFHFAYKDAKVSKWGTLKQNLIDAPESLRVNFNKYRELDKTFKVDLVISDFESFSFFYAKQHNLPLVSVDNMQVLSRGKLEVEIPESERGNFNLSKNLTKVKIHGCDHYFITSFFPVEPRKPRTTIVPPILRDVIINAPVSEENHILVYQTSTSQGNIIGILNEVSGEQFKLYGYNRSEVHGNVTLMPFSEEAFVADLASSKAVISNGGFTLLGEAVFMGKPVCSIPVKAQFEQYLNAAYIEKLGYGRNFPDFNSGFIKEFIDEIPRFKGNLKNYKQEGNKVLFEEIDSYIEKLKE